MSRDGQLKVLVIDDNEINGIVLNTMLTMYRFQVEQCESGKAALERISKYDYDIIIVDYMMPNMNGVEVIKAIRTMELVKHTPLLYLLTSTSYGELKEQCQLLGANGVFEKPLQLSQLTSDLEKYYPGISNDMNDHPVQPPQTTIWYCLQEVFNEQEMDFNAWKKYSFGKHDICIDLIQATLKEIASFSDMVYLDDSRLSYTFWRKSLHSLKSLFSYIGANQLYSMARELEETRLSTDSSEFLLFLQLVQSLQGKLNTALKQYQSICGIEQLTMRKEAIRKELETIKQLKVIDSLQKYDYHSIIDNLNELINDSYDELYVMVLEAVKDFSYDKAMDLMKSMN